VARLNEPTLSNHQTDNTDRIKKACCSISNKMLCFTFSPFQNPFPQRRATPWTPASATPLLLHS
jgi:hypothetical protein